MDELYELLLRAVQRGRPSRNGIWAAMDNFSRICVSILTNVMQTQEDREAFYLHVLVDYGKILARKPTFGVHCEDKWFEMVAEEDIGETRIHELLAQKSSDPYIARYLENNRQRAAKRESYQAMIQSETLKTKTAEAPKTSAVIYIISYHRDTSALPPCRLLCLWLSRTPHRTPRSVYAAAPRSDRRPL